MHSQNPLSIFSTQELTNLFSLVDDWVNMNYRNGNFDFKKDFSKYINRLSTYIKYKHGYRLWTYENFDELLSSISNNEKIQVPTRKFYSFYDNNSILEDKDLMPSCISDDDLAQIILISEQKGYFFDVNLFINDLHSFCKDNDDFCFGAIEDLYNSEYRKEHELIYLEYINSFKPVRAYTSLNIDEYKDESIYTKIYSNTFSKFSINSYISNTIINKSEHKLKKLLKTP